MGGGIPAAFHRHAAAAAANPSTSDIPSLPLALGGGEVLDELSGLSAPVSPTPAAFFVGGGDDDDDKHPLGGTLGAFPPALTTTPLPLLQNPMASV